MNNRIKPDSRSFMVSASSAALIALAAGCEAETSELADEPLALVAQAKPGNTIELRPNGVYFAEVTAEGTGCPAGTWNSSISSDGQVFTTTFSAYEIKVNAETANSTRDCALTMKLRSDAERSFAVLSVFYSGYAFLEPGITARQTVRYGFHGASADAGNSRTEFAGPEDRDFVIRDDVGVDKQKWSPCGIDHTLTASTEVRMQRGGATGSGYLNLSSADGSLKLELRLGFRDCAKGAANGGTKPAANAPAPAPGDRGNAGGNRTSGGNGRGNAPTPSAT